MAETRVAFIGAGAMGGSIARGLVASGLLDAASVSVAEPAADRRAAFEEAGHPAYASAQEMFADGPYDVVILAVKPQILPDVLRSLNPRSRRDGHPLDGQLVISIAAGVRVASIEALVPTTTRVIRVMPNLPVAVLSGATAVCAGSRATVADVELALALFRALGSAQLMSEGQLDVAGVVTGCGPALIALYVDDLVRAGVGAGLPAVACREMVLSTMRGVATQLLESGEHPRAYMERVTSPGGTTAAALAACESALFEATLDAVDAGLTRTRQLAGE